MPRRGLTHGNARYHTTNKYGNCDGHFLPSALTNIIVSVPLALSSETPRSSALPIPSSSHTLPPGSSTLRPKRIRARTSTMSVYTPPLPVVMSRDNSAEDIRAASSSTLNSGGRSTGDAADLVAQLSRSLEAGPSRLTAPGPIEPAGQRTGRRASKSVSGARPNIIVTPVAQRTQSYYTPQVSAAPAFPSAPVLGSPEVSTNVVKRRTSTPSLVRRYTMREDEPLEENQLTERDMELLNETASKKGKGKASDSRARSTSTSVVVPQTMDLTENSTYTFPSAPILSGHVHQPPSPTFKNAPFLPPYASSSNMPVSSYTYDVDLPEERNGPTSILTSAYNFGESSIIRLLDWTGRRRHGYDGMAFRRESDDSSEKGLNGSEDDTVESDGRRSDESVRRPGRYWGMQGPDDETEDSGSGYFALPPTPPDEEIENIIHPEFAHALHPNAGGSRSALASLPTPALSTRSLSRGNAKKNKLRKVFRRNAAEGEADDQRGWLTAVYDIWAGYKGGKTGEVLKELGWTVGILVATFFVTAGLVLWLIHGMPITTLKHFPQSTTDLQLLSAEIRSYMASSDSGWWHTVGVLFFVGCWKHAWSVPGAVVLNILVGSLLDPMPALALLTLITATGSLGAYTLSRPLAPLIAVLFPKPLSLVRAALAPDSVPRPSSANSQSIEGETITPIQASSDPSDRPIGGPTEKSTVWRRLLIMRAMGFVPWSGMNVACGVVGVDWKTFWLTTAAGSASWSYVTASVGHILARLKVPSSALASASVASGDLSDDMLHGESLTSLLRDPVLIFKLVFLSALTLLPVILKRRNNPSDSEAPANDSMAFTSGGSLISTSLDSSEGTSPRSSSSFELSDLNPQTPTDSHSQGHFRPAHPAISTLRLDLDGSGPSSPPMSPLSSSLAKFTPTPRMFDLFSIGRSAVRQGQRALGAGVRAVRGNGRGGMV
ncbi:hypothetical protein I317_05517 [Kwoniella heveanensis CBS 569]|nr:hypothetical protein I317_05517 [Kwoniella heveanensis CBS 569]